MFLLIILLFIFTLIYFLSMVCIQFNYISNLNLQFGSDINELCCDDNIEDIYGHINYLVKICAISLYKFSILLK
ncbi:hypothetical protein [Romboutsia sp.]|uniref:hypothetical protein n=1 Tax=Romboutsia sp. TaxID=1965302 RepID=UPI002C7FFEE8|nr:hypothetical protein [Romboutsia sp.]HSQ88971.1 hypothetical protein [Romboutsia sp.]